jgi:drug/metabolite transporter (DMT)-like permease
VFLSLGGFIVIKALGAIYFIWGFNWVVMKEANLFFPPIVFVAYRFALGAAILLLVTIWLRLPPPPRKYWKWIILTGILQTAVNNVAAQIGIQSLGAGLVAVLNYSMPVWVAILAHFFLREHLTLRKILGIVISMTGLFILMNINTVGNIAAILLTLAGAVAWAVANIIMRQQNQVMQQSSRCGNKPDCTIIQYTTWQMIAGTILLFIYMGFTDQGIVQWTPLSISILLYNGILASALAFFLWNYILSHMEASKASVAILAVPVVGVICGIIFLEEALTITTTLGMSLILIGITLIVTQKKAA